MVIKKNGIEILSLKDWERLGGPKSHDQWVDDRSAYETSRYRVRSCNQTSSWLHSGTIYRFTQEVAPPAPESFFSLNNCCQVLQSNNQAGCPATPVNGCP